jgi:hypothetical protein
MLSPVSTLETLAIPRTALSTGAITRVSSCSVHVPRISLSPLRSRSYPFPHPVCSSNVVLGALAPSVVIIR